MIILFSYDGTFVKGVAIKTTPNKFRKWSIISHIVHYVSNVLVTLPSFMGSIDLYFKFSYNTSQVFRHLR